MNKWLIGWNIVLTILLLAVVISGCSTYDPRYDSLYGEIQTNRTFIQENRDMTRLLAEAVGEMGNTLQAQVDWNENRISQVGEIVNQHSEALNEQNSEFDKLMLILKLAGMF